MGDGTTPRAASAAHTPSDGGGRPDRDAVGVAEGVLAAQDCGGSCGGGGDRSGGGVGGGGGGRGRGGRDGRGGVQLWASFRRPSSPSPPLLPLDSPGGGNGGNGTGGGGGGDSGSRGRAASWIPLRGTENVRALPNSETSPTSPDRPPPACRPGVRHRRAPGAGSLPSGCPAPRGSPSVGVADVVDGGAGSIDQFGATTIDDPDVNDTGGCVRRGGASVYRVRHWRSAAAIHTFLLSLAEARLLRYRLRRGAAWRMPTLVGREVVDHLVATAAADGPGTAVARMNELVRLGLVTHVDEGHLFQNRNRLYVVWAGEGEGGWENGLEGGSPALVEAPVVSPPGSPLSPLSLILSGVSPWVSRRAAHTDGCGRSPSPFRRMRSAMRSPSVATQLLPLPSLPQLVSFLEAAGAIFPSPLPAGSPTSTWGDAPSASPSGQATSATAGGGAVSSAKSRDDAAVTDDGGAVGSPTFPPDGGSSRDGSVWTSSADRRDRLTLISCFRAAVPVRGRFYHGRLYPSVFVGSEAVVAMRVAGMAVTTEAAVAMGTALLDAGVFSHVTDEHGFKDGRYFYRYNEFVEEEDLPHWFGECPEMAIVDVR